MKQLICEMCGSTDLMKQDGVFVCQTCGTKYSVEEAKKMMIEGTVEVTGTVRVDNSGAQKEQISNYLEMAKSALDGEDIDGAVSYCDRILEIDMENYEAWVLKAKSAGWGSSLNNIKVPQALTAAKKAINLAPDDKKFDVAAEIYYAIKAQTVSLLVIAQSMPVLSGPSYIQKVMVQWQAILTGIPYLSKELMEKEIMECQVLCKKSKSAGMPKDRMIFSAYYTYNDNVSYDKMFKTALAEKIMLEEKREQEFKEKAKAEAEVRKTAYWEAHKEEKCSLEAKKVDAESMKATLEKEMDLIPELAQKKDIDARIASIKVQMSGLGLFKGKEKKAFQAQIDDFKKTLVPIEKALSEKKAAIQSKIDEQAAIISEVNAEFAKDR